MDSGEDAALNFGSDFMRFEPEPVARLRKLERRSLITGPSAGLCNAWSAISVIGRAAPPLSNQRSNVGVRNFLSCVEELIFAENY